jgi:E3 ubiquitin-protein ligase RNF14
MRFEGCNHVFCRACTKEYLEVAINDGSVVDIRCPSLKCQTRVLPAQVKELVSDVLYERYDRLLLQRSLDLMADVHYCPRLACHCPVLIDEKDAMGSCPSCHYVFCIYCKMVYHGVSPCRIVSENVLLIREEYVTGSEATKRELEKRYGRKNIQRIVEESFSKEWLNENCKKCPQCSTHIQKIDGCNKMSCSKCHAYFCWLCLMVLNHASPYSHFNVSTSPCYNKLFQGVTTDFDLDGGDEDEEGGRIGVGWRWAV